MRVLLRVGMFGGLFAMLALCMGCGIYRVPVLPPPAGGFSSISAPMDVTFRSTEIGPKKGEATATTVLALFCFGDASIGQAARNGNISTIKHVDTRFLNVLGFYMTHTTIVYGE